MRDQIHILGIPIDKITMAGAMERIREFLRSDQHHLIITADASGIVQAGDDPEFKALFSTAALVTPDGAGLLWAAKRNGTPIEERVSGVDMVAKLCELSAKIGTRIYFLGAGPGVAKLAAEKLTLKYPGCNIVGYRDGYFKPDQDLEIAEEVAETKPDVLLVAMGIPRQEKFIAKTAHIIQSKVSMGIGGSFDVHSGNVKRAPLWVQKLHLEWLWRLMLNPKKIAKVKLLPIFVQRVLAEKSPKN